MKVNLRPGTPEDAEACGTICFEAFKAIADQHNFPPDFPSPEVTIKKVSRSLTHPKFYSVVAELDGRIVGSNFLDERSPIAGLGPITVDPKVQNKTIGRQLMEDVLRRAEERQFAGTRLVQVAYHNRSLCLYAKLGFETRDLLSAMRGPALALEIPGYHVRPATAEDLAACNAVCERVHGHDRGGELSDAIDRGLSTLVERDGRVTGYASVIAVSGHAAAETSEDLKALIAGTRRSGEIGFLLPTRNAELFRWCLLNGFKLVEQVNLMSLGLYNEPDGAWTASILY